MTNEEINNLHQRLINLTDDQKASALPGIFLAIKNKAEAGDDTAKELLYYVDQWIEIVGGGAD